VSDFTRAQIRGILKREKKLLKERRAKDFEDNRARYSAATEDAVSRVMMLEDLLEGDLEPDEAPRGNDSLDL
jgi:hypothetical protein